MSIKSVPISVDEVSSLPRLRSGNMSLGLTEPNESSIQLNLPDFKPSSLHVDYNLHVNSDSSDEVKWHRPRHISSATERTYEVPITSARVLTREDAVKKTLQVSLDIRATDISFEPGDSFGVVCKNDTVEVDAILKRLNLSALKCTPCIVTINKDSPIISKKLASLPKHIPSRTTSLFALFVDHCDIRTVPKKLLLRILSHYATNVSEKRRLQELSSRQGASDYLEYVVSLRISLLDLLNSFPSCLPPVEYLLENLPPLQPRAYSIANSPLSDTTCLKFVFNVVDIPVENGRTYNRGGVCTKWIDNLTKSFQKNQFTSKDNKICLEDEFQELSLLNKSIEIFMRKSNKFQLPDDPSKSLILIGPGTGIAPFIGFLEHRSEQKKRAESCDSFGDVFLFYGCRHKERDFLYKDRLESFESEGILSASFVCFSRDEPQINSGDDDLPPRYVQQSILKHGGQVYRLINDKQAVIFVCGDARGMAKDVFDAIATVVHIEGGFNRGDAKLYVSRLQETGRYLQDIWT